MNRRGERSELAGEQAPAGPASPPAASERGGSELTPSERARKFSESAIKTPANVITFLRLLFSVPVLVWILDEGDATWGTLTGWLVLWLTDGLDGLLARRDGTTRSGAFLDPLADKILVLGGFIALGVRGDFAWVPIAIVVVREVVALVYRTLEGRRGVSLPARRLGKWKANAQFLAVTVVLFPPTEDVTWLHDTVLWIAVALSIVSFVDLVMAANRANRGSSASERPRSSVDEGLRRSSTEETEPAESTGRGDPGSQ